MLAALVLATATLVLPPIVSAQPTLDLVLSRTTAYVKRFVEQLSTVVMEEDYRQSFFSGGRSNPARLRLVSEFLLLRLDDAAWVGFRDVYEVNGRRVRDRQDRLVSLFAGNTAQALEQARRISEESARYNIGAPSRTMNVPTYALYFLHPANITRFEFEADGENCADQRGAWRSRFEEVTFPTLTRGLQGIDLPADGHICVDPATGRILKTALALHHPGLGTRPATEASATVRFGAASDLELWVPVEMRESYWEAGSRRRTNSTATYRDFRQFQTGGRLVDVQENPETPAKQTNPQ